MRVGQRGQPNLTVTMLNFDTMLSKLRTGLSMSNCLFGSFMLSEI